MKSVKKKVFSIILIIAVLIGICAASTVYAMGANTMQLTTEQSTTNNNNGEDYNSYDAVAIEQEDSTTSSNNTSTDNSNHDLGLLAAALATGLSCIGAGIAVAMVASSAIGAISENPGLLGKTIIFAGLAEGIAIYGLIISIMILNKV